MEENFRDNKELFAAYIKFTSEFEGMKADSTNPFFKSTYISLDGILNTVRPILSKHGLATIQNAFNEEDYMCVKTTLLHESGEFICTDVMKMKPIKNNDPQALGSLCTYMKRYQLAALLGICESIDDDGNQATYGASYKSKKDDKKETKAGAINEAQIKRLYAIAHSKNVDREAVNSLTFKKFKKKVEALTKEEYDFMCNGYEKIQA